MNALTAMKQALVAMEQAIKFEDVMTCDGYAEHSVHQDSGTEMSWSNFRRQIANLHTAITEMEQGEPVAWMQVEDGATRLTTTKGGNAGVWEPLHTHSQDRDSIIEECAVLMETGVFECSQKVLAAAIRALKG